MSGSRMSLTGLRECPVLAAGSTDRLNKPTRQEAETRRPRPETWFDLHCVVELAVECSQILRLGHRQLGMPNLHCYADGAVINVYF